MMQLSANANGSGQLTAGELITMLHNVPANATVHIKTESGDQRDGPYWSIEARWTAEGKQLVPSLHYPPGVRGTQDTFGATKR